MQRIYGINPILEALKSNAEKIKEVIVAEGRKGAGFQSIVALASAKHIPVLYKDRYYIDKVAGCSTHQGVVAFCESFAYADLDEVIDSTIAGNSTILILDGITDPQNLGALIRTAHCLGVSGIIIPEDRAVSVTPAVIKASAGAAHWMPVVHEVNLSRAIEHLQKRGFWIYGTDVSAGGPIDGFNESGPIGLVLGSEGRGLRPSIKKKCDFLLSVPMLGMIGSLNVSVAAGIVLYEILKIRKKGK